MTTVQGPTVGRRRLRSALRRARDAAGMTQEQVAAAMDWSLSKVIRIEAGSVSVSTNDLKALLQHYRLTDPRQVAELVELARASRRRAWWSQYREALAPSYAALIGLEAEAVGLRFFQAAGIPGLLQTEAYARAIFAAAVPPEQAGPDDVDVAVEIRLRRQREVLGRPEPPAMHVVLDEATLRRQTGGAACLREQLRHLVAMATSERVTIQVLPFTATDYAVAAPFTVLEFADPDDSDVVYVEAAMVQDVIDNPDAVKPYQAMFRRLRDKSLSATASLALITKIADELR
ncbi:Helix-turn-helix domain-containing protein [Micromonospora pattaloongensis]|uniref:Helix-turn-helix domain-containing protein n=1 Tax=Micromonospora pattaloongensis TaxID=405436 RepID=A0A1H3FJM2_9ACTN|nr:helix-turn-helix transcriptional regulator [Micromonospora pattaloongensis]SDX91303.1 Helix-turn-helix domain-containing protein [Micromonospora pattaloongensis]